MEDAAEQPSVFLPDELIEEIFARMPAKSVQRCRCLSRAWAAALSTQGFVDRHLCLANRRGYRSLFFLPLDDSANTTVHAWSPGRPLAAVLRDKRLGRRVSAISKCRGLVVLEADRTTHFDPDHYQGKYTRYTSNHYVWNPSTGQITALPKGKESFGKGRHHHDNMGIGYDTRIHKHKVVHLYCRGDRPQECEVYDLNSTGQWRPPAGAAKRTTLPGFATNYSGDHSVFAQGHLYWAAKPNRELNRDMIIISFSISDEEFEILPPPPVQRVYPSEITELDGRLCMFNNYGSYKHLFDIWVLRDHPTGAWDIHCRIDLDRASLSDTQLICSSRINPLDIFDNGSRILLRPDPHRVNRENLESHQVFLYRPGTGDVEDLLVGGGIITHHTMARRVGAPYVESLESTDL